MAVIRSCVVAVLDALPSGRSLTPKKQPAIRAHMLNTQDDRWAPARARLRATISSYFGVVLDANDGTLFYWVRRRESVQLSPSARKKNSGIQCLRFVFCRSPAQCLGWSLHHSLYPFPISLLPAISASPITLGNFSHCCSRNPCFLK